MLAGLVLLVLLALMGVDAATIMYLIFIGMGILLLLDGY